LKGNQQVMWIASPVRLKLDGRMVAEPPLHINKLQTSKGRTIRFFKLGSFLTKI